MNRSFASAVGAFVAGVLALQFGNGWLVTTLSLLVGGVVAWIGYDVRGFVLGIARAFSETASSLISLWQRYASLRQERRYRLAEQIGVWCGLVMALPSVIMRYFVEHNHSLVSYPLAFLLILLAFTLFVTAVLSVIADETSLAAVAHDCPTLYLKYGNPISFCLWIIYLVLREIPPARALWRFLQLAFVYTHTDERKLCFVDAILGSAAGIYFHQPLVGAVVGGLIGKLYSPFTKPAVERLRDKFAAEELALAKK